MGGLRYRSGRGGMMGTPKVPKPKKKEGGLNTREYLRRVLIIILIAGASYLSYLFFSANRPDSVPKEYCLPFVGLICPDYNITSLLIELTVRNTHPYRLVIDEMVVYQQEFSESSIPTC